MSNKARRRRKRCMYSGFAGIVVRGNLRSRALCADEGSRCGSQRGGRSPAIATDYLSAKGKLTNRLSMLERRGFRLSWSGEARSCRLATLAGCTRRMKRFGGRLRSRSFLGAEGSCSDCQRSYCCGAPSKREGTHLGRQRNRRTSRSPIQGSQT
jgi:hypothetical protein